MESLGIGEIKSPHTTVILYCFSSLKQEPKHGEAFRDVRKKVKYIYKKKKLASRKITALPQAVK